MFTIAFFIALSLSALVALPGDWARRNSTPTTANQLNLANGARNARHHRPRRRRWALPMESAESSASSPESEPASSSRTDSRTASGATPARPPTNDDTPRARVRGGSAPVRSRWSRQGDGLEPSPSLGTSRTTDLAPETWIDQATRISLPPRAVLQRADSVHGAADVVPAEINVGIASLESGACKHQHSSRTDVVLAARIGQHRPLRGGRPAADLVDVGALLLHAWTGSVGAVSASTSCSATWRSATRLLLGCLMRCRWPLTPARR